MILILLIRKCNPNGWSEMNVGQGGMATLLYSSWMERNETRAIAVACLFCDVPIGVQCTVQCGSIADLCDALTQIHGTHHCSLLAVSPFLALPFWSYLLYPSMVDGFMIYVKNNMSEHRKGTDKSCRQGKPRK